MKVPQFRALYSIAIACLALTFLTGYPASGAATTAAAAGPGAMASLAADGRFTLEFAVPHYVFAGTVGHPVSAVTRRTGTDRTGDYVQVDFAYTAGGARTGGIRTYRDSPVVVFTASYPGGGANTEPFPVLASYPKLPYRQTYDNCFAASHFTAPAGKVESSWLSFDGNADGFVLSPASHFPVARTWLAGGALATGIDPTIATLPAGTTQQTVLVASRGINAAYRTWGTALTNLQGKQRPSNDADVTLGKLGYWTDNGATYYYRYDPKLGYAGTLQAVQRDWAARGITLGYLQLDSWFYPKGPNARWDEKLGTYRYQAAPELFPADLGPFSASIGAPLVTHARWIDPASPYRSQYKMSGDVVTDPTFWADRMGYLAANNVATYEQDWLCQNAQPAYNLTDRDAYLDNMARAAAANGRTLQYCMALPRDFLQASKYGNVTTIRVSEDHFERGKWDAALYTSQLAAAVGAWPWFDVTESTDPRNLLLATLSAGPVGVGDPIGAENAGNLAQVARTDGVIVKPDVPLTPTDSMYVADAAGTDAPAVASTYTDHGLLRGAYVYAYARHDNWPAPETVYQAEDATLSGPTVGTDHSGYTGRGFADFQHDTGDFAEWTVQAPASGTYTLMYRYANGVNFERPLDVTVNGTDAGIQRFPSTGGWDNWLTQPVVVQLHAGANTIRATATGSGGGNLDYLGVSAGTVRPGPAGQASFTPVSLGVPGTAYVYDYFAGSGRMVEPGRAYSSAVDLTGSYYIVVPVNQAGIAFLGDTGKFASLGRNRVTALADDGVAVRASVSFGRNEGAVTLRGFAQGPVSVSAATGRVSDVAYDSASRQFSFRLQPGTGSAASFTITPT